MALLAGGTRLLADRLNKVVALLIHMVRHLKNVLGAKVNAYFAALAELRIHIYRHGLILLPVHSDTAVQRPSIRADW